MSFTKFCIKFLLFSPGQPDPPRNLESQEVTTDTVRLSWQPPEYDGGSPITTYVIEKKTVKGQFWGRCISTRNTFHTVTGLESNTEYQFRVVALNLYGASEPCTATGTIATKRKCLQQNTKVPSIHHVYDEMVYHSKMYDATNFVVYLANGCDLKCIFSATNIAINWLCL